MNKKEKIMQLWRDNFHDSAEFIRFYFDRKYSDDHALLYEINHQPSSALLMLPYPMSWLGQTIQTSYISGACTNPEMRNQGLMQDLLKEAFYNMSKKGIAASILIPAEEWLFQYYGKMGYCAVFDYSTVSYLPTGQQTSHIICPEQYDPSIALSSYPYFRQKTAMRTCSVLHPEEDYIAIVEETYLSGGRLFVSGHPEKITGWAIAIPMEDTIQVKECLYDSPAEKEALLQATSQTWNTQKIICRIPPVLSETKPYGMARVIDVMYMLQILAKSHPHIRLSVYVTDPQLPDNTGCYQLANGECKKNSCGPSQANVQTHIQTLTQALFGYSVSTLPDGLKNFPAQKPYMNLMLD